MLPKDPIHSTAWRLALTVRRLKLIYTAGGPLTDERHTGPPPLLPAGVKVLLRCAAADDDDRDRSYSTRLARLPPPAAPTAH
jgi:hypothetical protein